MHYIAHLFIEMQSLLCYLILTILQFNSSSSLSIIGYVAEVKEFLMGH